MYIIVGLNFVFLLLGQLINCALPTQSSCGTPTTSPSISGATLNRIINGASATANSWPWMVSIRLLLTDGSVGSHFCGGVLIYENIVLTAAHCLTKYKAYQIVAVIGENDRTTAVTTSSSTVFLVNQTKYNDDYSSTTYRNDVGLMQLKKNATLNSKVALVCIPASSSDYSKVINKNVVLAGWGSITGVNSVSALASSLQQAILKVINGDARCTANGLTYDTSTNYCAIGTSSSNYPNACFGDSGGPLVFYLTTDSKWYVYGVTSYVAVYSDSSCRNNYPSFYTQVPAYLSWIEVQLNTAVWYNRSSLLKAHSIYVYYVFPLFLILLIK